MRIVSAKSGPRRGQALLLVVLLMLAVIMVGILFVAVVGFNQEQSSRMGDVIKATNLAEAAIRYADYMLTCSPEGADWRPPFQPFNPATYDRGDPATWPNPPVGFDDGTATPNMFGPDGVQFTDDDYYLDEEVSRQWAPLVDLTPPGSPGPSGPYYMRYGYYRYPDPNNAGANFAANLLDQLDVSMGHVLLRITYDPNPPFEGEEVANAGSLGALQVDPLSKYLKIEAIGVVYDANFVWRRLVAYKAIGLTDHILWVTDKERTGRPAVLGFGPWVDMDNNVPLTDNFVLAGEPAARRGDFPAERRGDFLIVKYEGPMRFNTALDLRGDNPDPAPPVGSTKDESLGSTQIELAAEPLNYDKADAHRPYYGGYLRDDRLEAQYGISESSQSYDAGGNPIPAQSTTVDIIEPSMGETRSYSVGGTSDSNFSTCEGRVHDGTQGFDADGNARSVDPLLAPDLFRRDPATGQQRYYALTRDSGAVVENSSTGETVNVGRYGHGAGVYVDNGADLQFVANDYSHDLQALIEDLLGTLSPHHPDSADSGWNATRTMYVPKGVEITLCGTEDAALEYGALVPEIDASPTSVGLGEVWWPGHIAGEPGIKITRHDKRWRIGDPSDPGSLGDDSGLNVMYRDYPLPGNQVIFAEGNVRIKGQLPPDPSGTGRYNLTVVSGGTIYVDGQILSPQDVYGRYTKAKNDATNVRDEENSYIALLARDCVVLNPTQIVPQLTQGMVTAASDDSTAPLSAEQHWEISPTLGGVVYSRWTFGEPPTTGGLTDLINLVAYQTGEDPGPTGLGLRLYNSADNVTGDYDFNPVAGSVQPVFLFTPFGALLPAPWNVEYLSPLWAPLVNTVTPPIPPTPTLPWALNGPKPPSSPPAPLGPMGSYISTAPGDLNALAFRYRDPGLGGGGTDYWLKRFKIEELDSNTGLAKGAVHAKVNALMYAQEGCFFIVPGQFFAPTATGLAAPRFRRYNYDLEIRGAIAENFHASPAAWREWQDRWAYPVSFDDSSGTTYLAWGTIKYRYDETLLANRAEPPTSMSGNLRYASSALFDAGVNLPKLPLLPTCPGLIYQGTGP